MPKLNTYIRLSIFLTIFLTACGGGGNSTTSTQNNIPTESIPAESNPPFESIPHEGNNQLPQTVSVSTTNLNQNQSIYAGQSFILTVTSHNGATAAVKFANSSGTPNSVTYLPESCVLIANSSCSTTVSVALSTPIVSESSANYATNVILTNTTIQSTNLSVEFKVKEPALGVIQQPQNTQIGYSTKVGFTIESPSIPNGVGIVNVHLEPTNGFTNLVQLDKTSCVITYQNKNIANGCADIQMTFLGPLSGNTAILAKAQYFVQAKSDEILVEPGIKPSINITSSLPGGTPANIIAGHSFTMRATSINGGFGTVYFSATDPGIKLSPTSCNIESGSYCQITATIALGTPPNLHDIIIDYQSGAAKLELTRYRFKSDTPRLAVLSQPKINSIRKGGTVLAGFTVASGSIPEGNGTITLNLTESPENVVDGPPSCIIRYVDNKIINNQCENLIFNAKNYGVSTISALADNFATISLNPIVVANKFVYVLGANQISMFGQLNDGSLTPIQIQSANPNIPAIPVEGDPGQMILSPDGKFLYVTDILDNVVVPYSVDMHTGLPVMQNNLKISTGVSPSKIVISSSGKFAYVTNYASQSISQYVVNKDTGVLTTNNPAAVLTNLSPVGIVLDPDSRYAYVNNSGSKEIYKYTIDSKSGSLGSRVNFSVRSDLGNPLELAINTTGGNIFYIDDKNITVLYKLAKNGNLTEPSWFVWYRNSVLTGLYFNPVVLPDGTNLGYLTTNTNVILYQIKINDSWQNVGSLSWESAQDGPNTMGFDRSGQYAYIGHQNSSSISMYKIQIGSDGGMSAIGKINSPIKPLGIVVSPN